MNQLETWNKSCLKEKDIRLRESMRTTQFPIYNYGELSADGRIQFSNHAAKLSSVEVEKIFERFYTVETARN